MVRDIRSVNKTTTFRNNLRAALVAGSRSNRPCENGLSACFAYIMVGEGNGIVRRMPLDERGFLEDTLLVRTLGYIVDPPVG